MASDEQNKQYPSPAELVRVFHETYGLPVRDVPQMDIPEHLLRLSFIEEEFKELRDSVRAGSLVDTADALADLVYVIYGYAHVLGIDLDEVLEKVQASNLSKLGADGLPIYITEGEQKGKVAKGPNFFKPEASIEAAFRARGWDGKVVPQAVPEDLTDQA